MRDRHDHAHETRRRTMSEQIADLPLLDVRASSIEMPPAPMPSSLAPEPRTRVAARPLAQDRAYTAALRVAPTQRARVLAHLRHIYPAGQTRDEIAQSCALLLQSVCGRIHELLNAVDRDDTPRPLVYEGPLVDGKARVYAYPQATTSSSPTTL